MAERQNKFAGALGPLRQPAPPEAEPAPVGEKPAAAAKPTRAIDPPAPTGGRGRKRGDPAYRPTTFFVRKETKRKAARLLEDQDAEKNSPISWKSFSRSGYPKLRTSKRSHV
jgi:hypothetical protein